MRSTFKLKIGVAFICLCTILYDATSQNVGIDIANPLFKLDVRNGSINTDSVYRIGTFTILSTKGIGNTFVGKEAGRVNTGIYNAFVGNVAGYNNMDGNYNAFFGDYTAFQNTTGDQNVSIGSGSLTTNTTGSNNTAVGYNAEVSVGNLNNATAIGANAQVNCSNCMVLGSATGVNGGTSNVNIGIGNSYPTVPLSFGLGTGDKISLYGDVSSNYGFGVQGALLQIHSDVVASDIAFGYGNSAAFTERMRIKGNGNVGIGTNNPLFKLDVRNGNFNVDSFLCMDSDVVLDIHGSNTFVGRDVGEDNTGYFNTFLGQQAGFTNTSGIQNSFYGWSTGYTNSTGNYNVFSGFNSGRNSNGSSNSFYGASSGFTNETGNLNSFFGAEAGYDNVSGHSNAFFGAHSGKNTTGNSNTALGSYALENNVTGILNTALGYNAEVINSFLVNATSLGSYATASCSNCIVLGSINGVNGATSNVNVGIGTTNPTLPLSFGLDLGDKISLYGDASANYGFGVQGALLQIHADVMASDIAFGYGSSNSFSEKMRIKGSGNVGIGIINPLFKLDVRNGSINTDSLYRIGTLPVLAAPGTGNLFVGKNAGKSTTGNNNAFGGSFAGFSNTTGFNNVFFGESAGWGNMTGHDNVFIGQTAGWTNQSGDFNSFIGRLAGFANTGDNNTALGYQALNANAAGTLNTAIGYNADVSTSGLSNATAVGANARVDCSDCMVLGSVNGINGGTSNVKVGIGINAPTYPLNFAQTTGDKISLYNDGASSYGFGIAGSLLQIHSSVVGADIAFGYGNSASFTERMRIKGTGFVGIGTPSPGYILDVAGRMRIRSGGDLTTTSGVWLNNVDNSAVVAFSGLLDDNYTGLYGLAAGWQFRMNLTTGNVAIGVGNPTEKLTVHGNFRANGNICYTGTSGACSDIRYKTNLSPLNNALDRVQQIQGLYYFWKQGEFDTRSFSDQRQIGFSAQEIEALFPEIVQTDAEGYKAVDYGRLTPVLVEAIKEQQVQIENQQNNIDLQQHQIADQQKQIDELRALLNDLKN